jgi:hypothetical protein
MWNIQVVSVPTVVLICEVWTMVEYKNCKSHHSCTWVKSVGSCPEDCVFFQDRDVVRVVRCKDCKYYERDNMFGGGYCYGAKKKLDDFCSCGERKGD